MTQRYPGGFVTKTPPTLNPALGNSTPGVWTLDQVMQNIKAGTWPAYDPYFEYTTLLLHGNGTNGAQNNTFLDSSTNNFTITRNGNTTQGTFTPYGSNWSNAFATSAAIRYPYTSSLTSWWTQNFTMEMWIFNNTNAVSGTNSLPLQFAHGTYTAASTYWSFGTNASGQLNFYYYNGGANNVTSTTTVSLGTWNHIAMVYTHSSGNISLYLNGVSVASATKSGTPQNNSGDTVNIGAVQSTYYNGYISNLRVLNGTALYSGTFTPSTAPLTAITNTQLLTCQSNRFVDNSTNNATPTIIGTPSVQRFSPFNPSAPYAAGTIGGSGYFDGSGDSLTAPSGACISGTGDFTAECWIFPTTVPGSYNIIGCSDSSNGLTMFGLNANGTIFYGRSGVSVQGTTSNSLNYNTWNHIAISRSSSTLKMFINGVQGFSGTETYSYASGTVRIGTDIGGSSLPYTGYISNFRIIQGSAIYTTGFTPPTAPLTAVSGTSLLLNMTNGGIIDNAMMNDLETVGNAQISTSVSKFGGGSMSFNGTNSYLTTPNAVQFNASRGDWTIEAWVNFNSNTVTQPLIVGNPRNFYFVYVYETSQTKIILGDASINPIIVVITPPAAGTWWHMCCVRSGSTYTVYQNGVAVASTTTTLSNTTLNGFYIGYDPGGGTYFNGYIDDFRITKGIARYTSNFTPQTSQWQDQ